MRTLVCVKRVPAPGAKINITDDGLDVDSAVLGFTTSPHEECAVEAAVQLREAHDGETVVLTLGTELAEEQLRYAASVGMTGAVLVRRDDDLPDWDPQRTARAIAAAIAELEATGGPFDLILFGNESADAGGFQVGIRVAHALDRPMVNAVKAIELGDAGDHVIARRETDEGHEIYELPLPACLGVKEGINLPRYPTMKGRLASKKLDITVIDAVDELGGLQRVRLVSPAEQVADTVILGDGPGAAPAVVDILAELGVLP